MPKLWHDFPEPGHFEEVSWEDLIARCEEDLLRKPLLIFEDFLTDEWVTDDIYKVVFLKDEEARGRIKDLFSKYVKDEAIKEAEKRSLECG